VRIGLSHAKIRSLNDALKAFEKANQIDPTDLEIISNRITVLKDLGDFDNAELLITGLSPEKQLHIDIAQATAGLFMAQNKLVEATYLLKRICEERPHQGNYWLNWAAALRGLRWTVAPYRILQRALCYEPQNEDVQEALIQILAEMGKNKESQRCLKIWHKNESKIKDTYLFNRQFLGIGTSENDSASLAKQARRWEERCQSKAVINLWKDIIQVSPHNRKLKVGYLSSDLANHPVGRFLLPILSNHNKNVVEVWALNTGSHSDWITDHIRDRVDHWIDLRFLSGCESARIIGDLGLDILVELGGFSADSRLEILCHKPAPIQLSYLGYPGPTYLKCVDGWIGDKILFEQLNPIDRSAHKLIEIEGGYMVFDSGGELPIPQRSAGKHFRFGSFNHARKLTEQTISLFCEVMAANPEAELALKSISFGEPAERLRIRQRFEQAGLEPERLILMEWVKGGLNHLKMYSEVDVALDPIPYGGATTTAEALWMGVPVVALAGQGMVGRLSASLLTYGNQKQWVARTKKHYIKIASGLANQGPRSETIRYNLRRTLEQSPLADGRRLSQELERQYLRFRQMISS